MSYSQISGPKPYFTIGSGYGYYIRTICKDKDKEIIYGFGLQLANWVEKGYDTIDRAKIAAKRLKKIDADEGTVRSLYEIVDGYGERVAELN